MGASAAVVHPAPAATPRESPAGGARLQPLDALRGAAMLFVFLSHFGSGYFGTLGDATMERRVATPGFVAIPAFLLVSGLVVGWMQRARPERFAWLTRYLRDRALFLLTVSHALFLLAVVPRVLAGGQTLAEVIVTDAIGVAMLVGPPLVGRTSARARLAIALGLYLLSGAALLLVHPTGLAGSALKGALVGVAAGEPSVWTYVVPVVPWLAVYLAGSVLGGWVATAGARDGLAPVASRLVRAGAGLMVLAAALRAAVLLAVRAGLASGGAAAALDPVTSPWALSPPGPGYLLLFGGAALVLAGVVFHAAIAWPRAATVRSLAATGRSSLFVFILQFFVFYGALPLLRLPRTPAWPLLFLLLVLALVAAARWWDAHGYNRLLVVPVPSRRDWPRTGAALAVSVCLLVLSLRLTRHAPPLESARARVVLPAARAGAPGRLTASVADLSCTGSSAPRDAARTQETSCRSIAP